MISIEKYKENPCSALSIPYWKTKGMSMPPNIKIVHNDYFDESLLKEYNDKKYFRLFHNLNNTPEFDASEIEFSVIAPYMINELVEMINISYAHTDVCVSNEYIKGITNTKVYCPELWIGAFDNGKMIGSIICDFDKEIGEGIIEWLQVLPEYRGIGIASALICKALNKMSKFANFVTVSGECDNITNPEYVYRKCKFEGNDIWHILTKK